MPPIIYINGFEGNVLFIRFYFNLCYFLVGLLKLNKFQYIKYILALHPTQQMFLEHLLA